MRPAPYFQASLFVLDTPRRNQGSHQAAVCDAAPREFNPSEVLSKLPPLVATVLSRSTLWPDRSIIGPIACRRRTGGNPIL
jgi:hypothetical protein